jgi:hypothetical protein
MVRALNILICKGDDAAQRCTLDRASCPVFFRLFAPGVSIDGIEIVAQSALGVVDFREKREKRPGGGGEPLDALEEPLDAQAAAVSRWTPRRRR